MPRPTLPASSAHAVVLEKTQVRKAAHRAALSAFFGQGPTRALTLEIGCGHGHFLTAYAMANPDLWCLGADLIGYRIERAQRKQRLAHLTNICFLKAEAFELLDVLPLTVPLQRVFILFADPWPKRRHHARRLLRPEMLDALGSRMAPDAQLCFRTDDAGFFKDAVACVRAHPLWDCDHETPWPFEAPSFFQDLHPSYQSFVARRNQCVANNGAVKG